MAYRRSASLALTCALATACASKLDFDRVSAGDPRADASVDEIHDAGSADAKPTPIDARDVTSREVNDYPEFGGELTGDDASAGNRPDPRALPDAATPTADSGQKIPSGLPDPATTFTCAGLSALPVFCDDFEHEIVEQPWTQFYVLPEQTPPTGRLEIDGTDARAGTQSMVAEVYAGAQRCVDNDCVHVVAGTALPDLVAARRLSIEFDLRVEQVDPTTGRWITAVQLALGDTDDDRAYHTLQLNSVSTDFIWIGLTEYQDNKPIAGEPQASAEFVHNFGQVLTLGQWAHVLYELDVVNPSGTGNTVRLSVDGEPIFDGPLNFALRGALPFMQIGVPWMDMLSFADQETTQAWRLRYDNVLVRIEPR